MRVTRNKNFATLFTTTPAAVQAGQKAIGLLPPRHNVMSARCVPFKRRVVGYEGEGWVITFQNQYKHDVGYLVLE